VDNYNLNYQIMCVCFSTWCAFTRTSNPSYSVLHL